MEDILISEDKNGGTAILTTNSPVSHYGIPVLRITAEDVAGDFLKSMDFVYGGQMGDKIRYRGEIKKACNPASLDSHGAPGPTRTGDLRIRNPSLYPPELQGQPT